MLEASYQVFPEAKYQRCIVHFYRNVFSVVPKSKVKLVAKMLKAIHAQESKKAAREKAKAVVAELQATKLKEAAKKIEDGIEETLTYADFPSEHWTRIRTNNVIERLNREIRRRTRVVGCFPDGKLFLSDDAEVRALAEGMHWLEAAVRNGSHYAAYRLGKEYLRGEVVRKDMPKALEYLNRSAEAGNQFAQYTLGKLYLMGREVPQDKELAEHWLTLSADQGNEYAKFFLDRMDQFREPSAMLGITRLLHHMAGIFRDRSLPKSAPAGGQIDRKLRRKLKEKKMAQGHKRDDHEEQNWTMSM